MHQARVLGRCEPTTGIAPFCRLVDQVMTGEPYASAHRVFWIVDNGASHRNWAAAARRNNAYSNAHMVHLPIHASRLNQVEIYFSAVQRKALTPDDVLDLDEVEQRLLSFQHRYNTTATPFDWRFNAAIETLVLSGVTQALSYGFKIIMFTGALFFINVKLALIAVPAFLVTARYFSRTIKSASRAKRQRIGAITVVAEESLSNIALVRAYGRHQAEVERFHRENLGSFTAELACTPLRAPPMVDFLELAGGLLVLGFAHLEARPRAGHHGGLLVFLGYLTELYSPVRGSGRLSNSIFAAAAGAERIIELLDQQPSVRDPERPRPLERARGVVVFDR